MSQAMGHIEAGWEGFREKVVPRTASEVQCAEMRKAFFAGAAYLFTRTMLSLDDGKDATEADLKMLDDVHAELVAFARSQGG